MAFNLLVFRHLGICETLMAKDYAKSSKKKSSRRSAGKRRSAGPWAWLLMGMLFIVFLQTKLSREALRPSHGWLLAAKLPPESSGPVVVPLSARSPEQVRQAAARLRQALENLLTNALKYSDGPVVVSLSAAGRNYVLEVRDEGIGIPAGEQAGIFVTEARVFLSHFPHIEIRVVEKFP